MRIAKGMVKDELRQHGVKPSTATAKDITTAAELLLKHDKHGPVIVRKAKRNLKLRSLPEPSGPEDFLNDDDELIAYAKKVNKGTCQ